jgi:hypothetical protein
MGVKWPESESDHSSTSSVNAKNMYSFMYISPYTFIACGSHIYAIFL